MAKNDCPGEGSAYGKWQTNREVKLFSQKSKSSKVVATLPEGEIVKAITGDVHTEAGVFILEKPFEHNGNPSHIHPIGERIFLYTYGGEGYYAFWCNGKIGGGFSPSDKGPGRTGHWEKKPVSVWWAKIQTKQGVVGWAPLVDPYPFDGTYEPDQHYIH